MLFGSGEISAMATSFESHKEPTDKQAVKTLMVALTRISPVIFSEEVRVQLYTTRLLCTTGNIDLLTGTLKPLHFNTISRR